MRWILTLVPRVGAATISLGRKLAYLAAVVWAVLRLGVRPRYWRRTVRAAFVRQVMSAGVEAVGLVCVFALVCVVLVVVQYQFWLGGWVQSYFLDTVMVVVVVREAGPLLVNFAVIARSGNAIATELGLMQGLGEVRVLDAQGLDPFVYLVLPRVLGLAVSVCCLTAIFVAVALLAGYFIGQWAGVKTGGLMEFLQGVLTVLTPADVINLAAKSVIPPLLAGAVCCTEGLAACGAVSDVSRAASRAVGWSMLLLFVTVGVITVLAYL